jgi:hypothetical protein
MPPMPGAGILNSNARKSIVTASSSAGHRAPCRLQRFGRCAEPRPICTITAPQPHPSSKEFARAPPHRRQQHLAKINRHPFMFCNLALSKSPPAMAHPGRALAGGGCGSRTVQPQPCGIGGGESAAGARRWDAGIEGSRAVRCLGPNGWPSPSTSAVLCAGDQLHYAGLDQVNLTIPRSLRGRGTVDLVLTVDGVNSPAPRFPSSLRTAFACRQGCWFRRSRPLYLPAVRRLLRPRSCVE